MIRLKLPLLSAATAAILLAHSLQLAAQTAPAATSQIGTVAAAMKPFTDRQVVAGIVTLVADKDKVLDTEAVGYADIARGVPMKTDDMFWIASMTKAFTTTAMMMLVDEGKVKLDDPAEKYLPELKGMKVDRNAYAGIPDDPNADTDNGGTKRKILVERAAANAKPADLVAMTHPFTIRELMSHTAGLRREMTSRDNKIDTYTLDEDVKMYAKDALLSQPGERFAYSDEGINITGRIIEVVSGMPYATFLQKRIFGPLGMQDTTFWPDAEQTARLAKNYSARGGKLTEEEIARFTYPLDNPKRHPLPAGGLFCTAADDAKFAQMLLNHGMGADGKRLISEESWKAMTTKETPASVKSEYGFGLYIEPYGVRHGGADKTEMDVNLQKGYVTVFMVQMDAGLQPREQKAMADALDAKAQAIVAEAGK